MTVLRIGLTGGIGSGKSTVGTMLMARGAAVIDADAISRAASERMRTHVFANPNARQQLEAIIHPLVSLHTQQQAEAALARGQRVLVFDVPLLVESQRWRGQVDRVLVVDCAPSTQIERVMARNGLPRASVEAILAAQATRVQRLQAADWVICNDGIDLAALRALVDALPLPH